MKIQYKAAILIFLLGVVIVCLFSIGYGFFSQKIVINKELEHIQTVSQEISYHLESHLKEKAAIALTLSGAPLIENALAKSNAQFRALSEKERKDEIEKLNLKWIQEKEINTPFVKSHMITPVAKFFKQQQAMFPNEYGEIFLTNRYGVMIASTGRLTTLAHGHKYWWKACYNDGKGRVFLDDRGFDTSVKGYVLGVVIPIRDRQGIIGILKCNVNIMGSLTDVIREFDRKKHGEMKIVRTGGMIVYAKGIPPLSASVTDMLKGFLSKKQTGSAVILKADEKQIVGFSPIPMTLGSETFGFGGKQGSIDHMKGNTGEAWYAVVCLSQEIAVQEANSVSRVIIVFGIIVTLLVAAVSLILSGWASKPIVELAAAARDIGQGKLDTRTSLASNDEIGILAKALNEMAGNLQKTMTSRNKLRHEVEQRKKMEKERETFITELQDALAKVKVLSGLLPICARCKKIRDDQGYWNNLESYLQEHSNVSFSHGMCMECSDELYKDQDWYQKMKNKPKK